MLFISWIRSHFCQIGHKKCSWLCFPFLLSSEIHLACMIDMSSSTYYYLTDEPVK